MPAARADTWDQLAKDSAHTSAISEGPKTPLKRAWLVKSQDPRTSFTSWPVVRDGFVYAPSGPGIVAVDAGSGQTLWWKDFGGMAQEALAADSSNLYAPLGTYSMVALNRQTAATRWTLDLGPSGADDPSPTLSDGKLFFAQADAHAFYCVDTSTGTVIWKKATSDEPTYIAAAADNVVVMGTEQLGSGAVRYQALEASTGSEIWNFEQSESSSSPTISGHTLVVGGGDFHVYAINLEDGRGIWSSRAEGRFDPRNVPAFALGDFFLADRIGNIYRIDGTTGKRKWIFRDTEGNMDQSFPVIAGETLFAGSGSGHLYALDVRTGQLLWKGSVKGIVLSGAADKDRFYFGVKLGADEGLHAFEHDPKGKLAPRRVSESPVQYLIAGLVLVVILFGGIVIFSRLGTRSAK